MFVPPHEIQFQWNEPYFFTFRTMGRRGLLLRGFVFLVLCTLFTVAFVFESRSREDSRTLLEGLILVLLASAVITVLLTAPSIQRRVTLSRDGLSWANLYPASLPLFFLSLGALGRLEIRRVVLHRPKESGNRFPYGVMVVERKYANPRLIAVPNEVPLENLAQVLSDNGVPVTLSDWRPRTGSGSAENKPI